MHIRPISSNDAAQFLALRRQLDEETAFMLLEPGERTMTLVEQEAELLRIEQRSDNLLLVAEKNAQLVGYLEAIRGEYRRNRHCAYIVIGILQAFTGQGLGTQLFAKLEEWASQQHIHRLELTVMTHNQAGVALYEKRGFVIEGVRRHAIYLHGRFVDEYYMSKLIEAN